jgi:HSP20 family molecular chaperone IbpA
MTKRTNASDALPADVLVNDEGLIRIEVDVPGLEPTIGVHARGHTVIVDGHRTSEPSGRYLLHERASSFHREFVVPAETDMRNVHARIHDGVLTISALVGAGQTQPGEHRIEVLPSAWACHPDAAAI